MATNNQSQQLQSQPGAVAQELAKLQPNTQPASTPPTNAQHPSLAQTKKGTPLWTGFSGKTLWDWLPLIPQFFGALAIPLSLLALYISVGQFNAQQKSNNQQAAEQAQAQFQNQKDQQQQATLDTYLDRMSDLLLNGNLDSPQAGVKVLALARVRTFTALRILDPDRKGVLLEFLYDSNLIGYETISLVNRTTQITIHKAIMDLVGADLC